MFSLGVYMTERPISTRIWTRALQPVQEEVSSWRFRRAQTVSGPPTFSRSADISLGAEISTPAKILSYAYISARRQHFVYPPIFWEAPIFCVSANILEGANILYIRQYFPNPPIFLKGANILWICLILLLQIFVYIFSIYFYAFKYAPIFFGAIVLTLGLRLIL